MHQQISNGFAAGILFLVAASLQMVQAQDAGEPVWDLDPFVVSTDNVGYQARNSLSATKFDIEVRSVPITVTSLTQEYLEDTYSQSIEDAVRFSAGVTRADTVSGEEGDSFFIRGLKTARTKRNGIVQLYTQDLTNVQRVEVVKGPMSLLYGQVEPGGLINYVTMNALSEQTTSLKLVVGSYDHYRAQMNHTGPILKGDPETGKGQLLYRVDASYKREDGWRDKTEDERTFSSLLLEYKPFASTTVEIQWDRLNQNGANAAPLPVYNREWKAIFDEMAEEALAGSLFLPGSDDPIPVSSLVTFGRNDPVWGVAPSRDLIQATPLFGTIILSLKAPTTEEEIIASNRQFNAYAEHFGMEYNPVPINAFNDMDMDILQLEIRQKLFDEWFAKLFIVKNDIHRESLGGGPSGRGINGWRQQSDQFFPNNWDRYNDDITYQFEVTGKWELGPVENETIAGLEYAKLKFDGLLAPETTETGIVHSFIYDLRNGPSNPYILPGSDVTLMDTFFVPTAPSPGRPFNPRNSQENIFEAAFISNISRFMNGRLLVLGGLRLDRSEADLTLQGSKTNSENESTSPQIAASYEVADDITIYASYSESFVPQVGQGDRLITPEEQAQLVADANASGTILQADDFRTQYPLLPWLGSGFEFGAKFDLLDGKLSGSMAYFDVTLEQISQKNSIPVDLDALGYSDPLNRGVIYPQVDLPNNVRSVKGFETELFLRPFEGFQAVVSYAYIEAGETLDLGFRQFESPAITVPLHQVSVWTKYEFNEGRLEGAYLGGGFTWMDKRYGSFQLSVENPSPTVKDGRVSIDRNILLDDQITFDLLFGYKFTAKSADVDIQVNIKNLLDDRFILPGGMPNAPLQAFLSFQVKL